MSKVRYKKGVKYIPVEVPKEGMLYHVSWGYRKGVVGRCMSVDEESKTVILRSPVSKTNWANPVKWSDLLHTRKQQSKMNK